MKTSQYVGQVGLSPGHKEHDNFINMLTNKSSHEVNVVFLIVQSDEPIPPAPKVDPSLRKRCARSLDNLLKRLDTENEMVNVFIDDSQISSLTNPGTGPPTVIFRITSESSDLMRKSGCFFWVATDEYQDPYFNIDNPEMLFEFPYSPKLTRNLRNSTSIAKVTLSIREELHRINYPDSPENNNIDVLNTRWKKLTRWLNLDEDSYCSPFFVEPPKQHVYNEEELKYAVPIMKEMVEEDKEKMTEWGKDTKNFTGPRHYVGHTVHGAKVQILMIKDQDNIVILGGVIKNELNKLKTVNKKDYKIIYNTKIFELFTKKERENLTHVDEVFSGEWAAVVAIIDVDYGINNSFLDGLENLGMVYEHERISSVFLYKTLYLAISRARVYCTVILTGISQKYARKTKIIFNILDKLDDHMSVQLLSRVF